MTEPSQTSLVIVSLCKMGWCYHDSCFWAEEIDAAVPANKLPQLRADIERISSVADRKLALLAALGVKPNVKVKLPREESQVGDPWEDSGRYR